MKKVIIAGASSGIGRELAKLYAKDGFKVGITGRRKNLLEELEQEFPATILIQPFDHTSEHLEKNLGELISKLGGLDLFILSAGNGELNSSLNWQVERATLDLNVIAWTEIADFVFNFFSNQKYGQLAAITSIAAIRGEGRAPAYNASKAFQANYLDGLRKKAVYEKLSISITDIRPGFVKTAMAKSYKRFWEAPVEKAAKQIYIAIQKKKKTVYITKRWNLIAFMIKILPDWIYYRI